MFMYLCLSFMIFVNSSELEARFQTQITSLWFVCFNYFEWIVFKCSVVQFW